MINQFSVAENKPSRCQKYAKLYCSSLSDTQIQRFLWRLKNVLWLLIRFNPLKTQMSFFLQIQVASGTWKNRGRVRKDEKEIWFCFLSGCVDQIRSDCRCFLGSCLYLQHYTVLQPAQPYKTQPLQCSSTDADRISARSEADAGPIANR